MINFTNYLFSYEIIWDYYTYNFNFAFTLKKNWVQNLKFHKKNVRLFNLYLIKLLEKNRLLIKILGF